MARIRSLEEGKQKVSAHTSLVDCFYQTVDDKDGTRLLHLTTFGSDDRKSSPKSSQSIQIDAETAAKLVTVIRKTFPSIAVPEDRRTP